MKMSVSIMVVAAMFFCGSITAAERQLIDLGTVGGWGSSGWSINDLGQVVGSVGWPNTVVHGFLCSNGTMTDLGTMGTGTESHAFGINNSGQVVGWSYTSASYPCTARAYVYANGVMTGLGTLGGTESGAMGINGSGQVVGWADCSSGYEHAFVYSNGSMSDLGTLGGTRSWANSINDQGQIVGISLLGNGDEGAFLYNKGAMIDLGTLGGNMSEAWGINGSGAVVGVSDAADGRMDAFMYVNGQMANIGAGWGLSTGALGINDEGQAVGFYSIDGLFGTETRALLWQEGVTVDLNTLLSPGDSDWVLNGARDINNDGWIVGTMTGPDNVSHAFILTPEPGTMVLLAFGGVLLRRRR